MGLKKNAFSYLIWFIYTILTGIVLGVLAWDSCVAGGIGGYWGIAAVVLLFAVTGGVVCLLRRLAPFLSAAARNNGRVFVLLEILLAAAFVTAGFIVRLCGMGEAGQDSVYYDAARVVEGQGIVGIPHAAADLYVRMLRGVFILLGNRFTAGIWLQILLQLAAVLVMFFVVRKLAGPVAGLVVLGYCCLAPYMVKRSLALSPEMLYLLVFMVALAAIAGGAFREMHPRIFWLTGALTAFCCYLDIAGCLLIYLAAAGRKISRIWRYAAGVVLGFLGCCVADALFSGATIWGIARTWLFLYAPEGFRWSAVPDASELGWEAFVLFGLMAFGIYSFWLDRERDRIKVWMPALCGLALAGCFGVFTEEMPGSLYMYLCLVLLAGMGVGQIFHGTGREKAEERYGWEVLIEKMEENEARREALSQERRKSEEGNRIPGEERRISEEGNRMSGEECRKSEEGSRIPKEENGEEAQIQYLENPLPLPKKHVKRILDYSLEPPEEKDDFDYPVSEGDDFDI